MDNAIALEGSEEIGRVSDDTSDNVSIVVSDDDVTFGKYDFKYFINKLKGKHAPEIKHSKKIKRFYKKQDEVVLRVKAYLDAKKQSRDANSAENMIAIKSADDKEISLTNRFSKGYFSCNIVLIAALAVAIYYSNGSLSIIATMIDCFIDISTTIIIWVTSNKMKKKDYRLYPAGRRRMEPVAIVILSAIMAIGGVEIIKESIQSIIAMVHSEAVPNNSLIPIIVVACTLGVKLSLLIASIVLSKVHKSSSMAAMSLDAKNDVLTNSVVIISFGISSNIPEAKYLDPVGAIIIAIYIIVSWWRVGMVQSRQLTGRTADPGFIQSLTLITLQHHPSILLIDTVRAYHFGVKFLVEIDIVLRRDMILSEAHDIGESLQQELESLEEIERAFVHLDYECEHNPNCEHKL